MTENDNHEQVVISADLVKLAAYEVEFLQQVDSQWALRDEQSIRRAIWRYEQFWLPLVVKFKQPLVPPLDVHWIWHCHMLSPRQYDKDCTALVGKRVEHWVVQINSPTYKQLAKAVMKLWIDTFESAEPYNVLSHTSLVVPEEALTYQSRCKYDLLQAALRQSSFYYNVSLPHYKDVVFLTNAFERYKKYLLLTKKHPSSFLVPCYDIDLMWHTHQLMTVAYRHDVAAILGYVLNHDDTDTDRSPGSKLTDSFANTRELWKEAFNEEYTVSGAMYRGASPAGKLQTIGLTSQQRRTITSKRAIVTLTHVTLDGVDDATKVRVDMSSGRASYLKLVGPPNVWTDLTVDKTGICPFTVDSPKSVPVLSVAYTGCKSNKLHFNVVISRGRYFYCVPNKYYFDFEYSDLDHEVEATLTEARTVNIHLETNCKSHDGNKPRLTATLRIEPPVLGDIYLRAAVGKFTRTTMPETIEQMWGPIPVATLPAGVENVCAVALHSILDHRSKQQFTCRIIHSLPLQMSAVQIFYKDKMVAVSHLIGSEQLPAKTQVTSTAEIPVLDTSIKKRAFLIKDNAGDWGVCTACWTGVEAGTPGVRSYTGRLTTVPVAGHPGYLTGQLYRLRHKDKLNFWVEVARDKQTSVKLGNIKFDVKTGNMAIDATEPDIAQYMCTAYTIATLHLLCQPHGQAEGKAVPSQPKIANTGEKGHYVDHTKPIYMDDYSAYYAMIASTGLYCDQVPPYSPVVTATGVAAGGGSVWDMVAMRSGVTPGCGGCTTCGSRCGGCVG